MLHFLQFFSQGQMITNLGYVFIALILLIIYTNIGGVLLRRVENAWFDREILKYTTPRLIYAILWPLLLCILCIIWAWDKIYNSIGVHIKNGFAAAGEYFGKFVRLIFLGEIKHDGA